MVVTTGTLENPQQIVQDMYGALGRIQAALTKHMKATGLSELEESDEATSKSVEMISSELYKLYSSFERTLFKDAERIAAYARKNPGAAKEINIGLQKITKIFDNLRLSHRHDIRNEQFFYSFATKLERMTKNLTKGVAKLDSAHKNKIQMLIKELKAHHNVRLNKRTKRLAA